MQGFNTPQIVQSSTPAIAEPPHLASGASSQGEKESSQDEEDKNSAEASHSDQNDSSVPQESTVPVTVPPTEEGGDEVTWDGPTDPENPQNWTFRYRAFETYSAHGCDVWAV